MKLKIGSLKTSDHDSTKVKKPSREELSLPEDTSKPIYGIRNYLHQFYQSPTVEDLEGAGGWYLLPPNPRKHRGLVICRAFTILGLVLLLIGATTIVVGYTWPKPDWGSTEIRLEIHTDEHGQHAKIKPETIIRLYDPMHPWKFAGLAIFTLGGVILAVSLLVPTCANCLGGNMMAGFASEFDSPAEPPIRIYPTAPDPSGNGDKELKQPLSPVESKVPVMEAISKVQPDPEPGEGRITGENLQTAEQEAEIPAPE